MHATNSPTARQRLGLLAAGSLAGVLVAITAGPSLVPVRAADDEPQEHFISVSGEGRVFVKPDVADLQLGVRVQRDRAGAAAADAAEEMSAVVAAVLAQGVAEDDIQTADLSLQPVYDYDRDPAVIVAYEAVNIVSIVARDLEHVGALIDAATKAGATSVNGISFRLEDSSAVEAQARELAMTDARSKADALAGAAGVRITGVISIVESGGVTPPYYYDESARGAAGDASTPVLTGRIESSVYVAVVYSIG
jgi:uncharacterized protein YggE